MNKHMKERIISFHQLHNWFLDFELFFNLKVASTKLKKKKEGPNIRNG